MHFEKVFTQAHGRAVACKTAGQHKPAGGLLANGFRDPSGDLFAPGKVRHFIQAIEQEKEIPAAKEPLAKVFRCIQVGTGKLVLDERVQSLVEFLQVSERQEDRQHSGGKFQGLGAFAEAPQEQPLQVGRFPGAGISKDDYPLFAPSFSLAKGFHKGNLKAATALPQTLLGMGCVVKGFFGNPPKVNHCAQGNVNILNVDRDFELRHKSCHRQGFVQRLGLLTIAPNFIIHL